MSTATAFKFPRLFPFCPSNPTGSYVGSLTLAQVMAFWWNLEYAELFTSATLGGTYLGSSMGCSATGQFELITPGNCSGDWSATNCGAYATFNGSALSTTTFAAVARAPRSRMCFTFPTVMSAQRSSDASGANGEKNILLTFAVRLDPVNAGYYAIEYLLFINSRSPFVGGASASLTFQDTNPGSNIINSGSFTIAGVSFPYWCSWSGPVGYSSVSTAGGTINALSSLFTY